MTSESSPFERETAYTVPKGGYYERDKMATCRGLRLVLTTSRTSRSRHACLYQLRGYSLAQDADKTSNASPAENSLDEEERTRVNELTNVSRLPSNHYRQYHGQAPDLPYKDLYRKKMLYAQFGSASGEDPRILWPTRGKLLDLEQEEQEEGSPLSERLAQLKSEKEEAEKAKLAKREAVAKKMNQMPKLIEEYRKKEAALERTAKEKATKKEALLQEAQEHYGYKIQANDPKFKEMVEEKELQEKTEKKKRKKEEKLQKLTIRQQQQLSEVKEVNKEE